MKGLLWLFRLEIDMTRFALMENFSEKGEKNLSEGEKKKREGPLGRLRSWTEIQEWDDQILGQKNQGRHRKTGRVVDRVEMDSVKKQS